MVAKVTVSPIKPIIVANGRSLYENAVDIMARVDKYIVMGNPVDTGRARSNWLASIAKPRGDTLFEDKLDAPKGSLNRPESEDPRRVYRKVTPATDYNKPVVYYLSNSLPYIEKLENSHPSQAGFVERGVKLGVRSFRKAQRRG